MDRVYGGAPDLERQESGRMGDLLREVYLEVPEDLAAGLPPTLHGRVLLILLEFAALVQYLIHRLVPPLREHLDSRSRLPAHRCLHSGRRFSTNACSPSSASSVSMSSSM